MSAAATAAAIARVCCPDTLAWHTASPDAPVARVWRVPTRLGADPRTHPQPLYQANPGAFVIDDEHVEEDGGGVALGPDAPGSVLRLRVNWPNGGRSSRWKVHLSALPYLHPLLTTDADRRKKLRRAMALLDSQLDAKVGDTEPTRQAMRLIGEVFAPIVEPAALAAAGDHWPRVEFSARPQGPGAAAMAGVPAATNSRVIFVYTDTAFSRRFDQHGYRHFDIPSRHSHLSGVLLHELGHMLADVGIAPVRTFFRRLRYGPAATARLGVRRSSTMQSELDADIFAVTVQHLATEQGLDTDSDVPPIRVGQ